VAIRARMGAGPLTVSELSGLAISMSDFEAALPKVQPSVRREGFTTKPDATWEDVGSLEEVRGSTCSSSSSSRRRRKHASNAGRTVLCWC